MFVGLNLFRRLFIIIIIPLPSRNNGWLWAFYFDKTNDCWWVLIEEKIQELD
jgi:hypothetical protein